MAKFKSIRVDDRIIKGDRMWVVTGVHMGAIGQENLITLRSIDMLPGCAYGQTADETVVPEDLIDHEHIYRQVDHDADNKVTSIQTGITLTGPNQIAAIG